MNAPTLEELLASGNYEEGSGILELHPDGYGFLRAPSFLPSTKDIYVSMAQIRRFGLRTGDFIEGKIRPQREGDKYSALLYISTINGVTEEEAFNRPAFDELTPVYPTRRISLETPGGKSLPDMRLIDLIAPIGFGQRGLVLCPPDTGKTDLMRNFARVICGNYPDAAVLMLLIDVNPEDATLMRESVPCQVLSSSFDQAPESHLRLSEIVLERAMRLVERAGGFAYLAGHIWILALAILVVAAVKALAQYIFRVSNTKGSETLVKNMRDRLFAHIERLPFAWHMRHRTGDIIQRCTSDIETLKRFVSEQMTSIFRIVVLLVLSLAFMLSMNPLLTLIAMLPVPYIIWRSFYFHRRIGEAFLDCDENEGKLSAMAQENLTGVRVVRAFGRERYEKDRFEAQNAYYTGLWMKLAHPLARFWSVGDIFSGVQILLIVVFGSVFAVRGEMLPGEYIAFLSYGGIMTWPVRMLGRMISEMSKAGVSIDRVSEIMRAEEEKESEKALTPPMDGEIRFEHVSFAYDGPEILHDVSFSMAPGSTLGILGGTGSGKSTMMLLLDKLYELPADRGTISVGGVDIRDISTP